MPSLLIASLNTHKAAEIATILGENFDVQSLARHPGAPEVEENGDTFTANAVKKAVETASWLGGQALGQALPDFVLADDSGLAVDALGGAPGVRSARYAGGDGNSTDAANNAKLLRALVGVADGNRGAQFQCVLALAALGQAGEVRTFEGICRGRIARAESGEDGFGYDPLFIPDGHDLSFAELGPDIKNSISHRARALAKLADHFASN
jgi:XTP/dITP diphosphohydrolase